MFSRESKIIHRQILNLRDMVELGDLTETNLREAVAKLIRQHKSVGYTNQELLDGLLSFRFANPKVLDK